jgi:hypothetical protein
MVFLYSARAQGTYHFWVVNEVYSNGDGSIQFVELLSRFSSQHELSLGATLIARDTNGAERVYAFTSDLPSSSTFNKTMLLATPEFAAQPGAVPPDFIIEPGFVFRPAGSLQYPDNEGELVEYVDLPTDGTACLVRAANGQLVYSSTNSPRNFAGQTGSLQLGGVRLLSPALRQEGFVFSFNTSIGKTYTVESTDTLTPTNWQMLVAFPGTGATTTVTNDATTPAQRFYRLRVD